MLRRSASLYMSSVREPIALLSAYLSPRIDSTWASWMAVQLEAFQSERRSRLTVLLGCLKQPLACVIR